jgi:hypothetical protein
MAPPRTSGDASCSKASQARHEVCLAAVARCNQRIAQKTVAADPLDRRSGEKGPKCGIIHTRENRDSGGERRSSRATSFISLAACAYLFHGQAARQSSQP